MRQEDYSIRHFLRLYSTIRAAQKDPGNGCYWIASNNIAKGLAVNPHFSVSDFNHPDLRIKEFNYNDLFPILLGRRDKKLFIGMILDVLATTSDTILIEVTGTQILSDDELSHYHARAMELLRDLKNKQSFNWNLKEYLAGPCHSYYSFIQYMLRNARSVEEAERWINEYDGLEKINIHSYLQAMGELNKPECGEKYRKLERERINKCLAGNPFLPFAYLRQLYPYADSIEDELARISFWCSFGSNPGIPLEDYRMIFEKKMHENIRNKQYAAQLMRSLAANPTHFRIHFDDFIRYIRKKPARGRIPLLSVLMENRSITGPEITRLLDIITTTPYCLDTKNLTVFLRQWGWMLYSSCLGRSDLTEDHHAKIRGEVIRILDLIGGEEYYTKYPFKKREFIEQDSMRDFHILIILGKVRLTGPFVRYLFTYAEPKVNGGLLLSGLLPNPDLSPEDYTAIVKILETQYVGKESELFKTQCQLLYAEVVYKFWAASPYVC